MPTRMITAMLLALLISIPVYAQEISADKEADIRLLLELSRVEEMMQVVLAEAYKPMAEQLEASLSSGRADEIVAELSATVSERFAARMIPKALPIYDKYFTHDEIKSMIQYLESPVGQKALQLQAQITQELMDGSRVMAEEIVPEVLQELQAKHPELRRDPETELIMAAAMGQAERVRSLAGPGVYLGAKNENGFTALMMAAVRGHTQTVQALVEVGAFVDDRNDDDVTALMLAAVQGHTETVQALVEAGADMNARDKDGTPTLLMAAGQGRTEAAKPLLAAGADVEARGGIDEATALMVAAYQGHTGTVRALLEAGASVESKDNLGQSALAYALLQGHTETVKTLLEAGADGASLLMEAAIQGETEMAETLLEAGVDVETSNEDGILH